MNGPGVVSFVEAQQAVRRLVLEHYKRDKVPTVSEPLMSEVVISEQSDTLSTGLEMSVLCSISTRTVANETLCGYNHAWRYVHHTYSVTNRPNAELECQALCPMLHDIAGPGGPLTTP